MRTDTSGAVEMSRMRHFRLSSEILRLHQPGGVCGRNIMARHRTQDMEFS